MLDNESDKFKHLAASAGTEARYPTGSQEAPDHAGRRQLIALAVVLGVPFLLLIVSSLRQ